MITSAAPNTITRYSSNPRNRSGSQAMRNRAEDDAEQVARPAEHHRAEDQRGQDEREVHRSDRGGLGGEDDAGQPADRAPMTNATILN
jgi:hypothetical protein